MHPILYFLNLLPMEMGDPLPNLPNVPSEDASDVQSCIIAPTHPQSMDLLDPPLHIYVIWNLNTCTNLHMKWIQIHTTFVSIKYVSNYNMNIYKK